MAVKTDGDSLTWNLAHLFKGDNDPEIPKFQKMAEKNVARFVNKWEKRDDYLKDPQILAQALDDYEKLWREYGTGNKVSFYFELRTEQDQNNPELKAKFNQTEDFTNKMQNQIQFFYLKISHIPSKEQNKFLKSPQLKNYRHYLERAFKEAEHLLSDPEEKIMTLKASVSHDNWKKMTSGFLSKEERKVKNARGKEELKSFTEIIGLLSHQNKKVRDSAGLAFNDILQKYVEVAENEINSILANKKINDELRHHSRPDEARHLGSDIDSSIVDLLTQVVSQRFDIAQKYYQLKAKLMGVKKLEYHERNVEIGQVASAYTYDKAAALILKVLQDLDEEFGQIFTRFRENGHIDVFPRKSKKQGAFCAYNLLTDPTYMMLNHNNRLDDVLTIAHEMGHGINFELMRKTQNSLNFSTPLSVTEVASTFFEDFVLQELLKEAGEEERLSLMMAKLNGDISSIFRQISCYRFEQELHQSFRLKGYLSHEEIGKLFQKHMAAYMGKVVEQSRGSENWWVYWSHIRNFFYNYSYANGLLISKYLQRLVKNDPQNIQKVKEFLAAGASDSPENIFAKLGINLRDEKFWNQSLEEIESLLKDTQHLAKRLGKIKG